MMPSLAGDVYFVLDEVLGDGDEVVEDVLLLLEHAGLVPRLAVLGAAAHVRGHPHAAGSSHAGTSGRYVGSMLTEKPP